MTRHRVAPIAALMIVTAGPATAQNTTKLEEQLGAIVRIEPAGGTAGSGLVLAVEANRIRILTARHVLEAGVVRPTSPTKPDISVRRECSRANQPFRVTFEFAQNIPIEATQAYCSDAIDAAVIDIPRPVELKDAIPRFAEQRRLTDLPGYQVFLAGLAQGRNWTPLPGAVASRSAENLQVRGTGIGPGFSGGAVFDTELRFVGMIVRAGDTLVNAVPAATLHAMLQKWGVATTHLEGAPTQPESPRFAARASPGFREENARNAIRRYRGAFENMEAAVLAKAYPSIGKRQLSLFGDAIDIRLDLSDCSDINLKDRPPDLTIKCSYALSVTRRTGRPFQSSSCDYVPPGGQRTACVRPDEKSCRPGRMVFTLASSGDTNDPFEWAITDVTADATFACQAPATPQ